MNRRLSKEEIFSKIEELETEYPGATSKSEELFETFSERIERDYYSSYNKDEQTSLLTRLLDQWKTTGSVEKAGLALEREEQGIKNLEVYYNFVGEEEVKRIQRAIIDNDINRNILKGIKVTDRIINDLPLNTGERIMAEFATVNGSPILVYMEIWDKNGKSVYKFGSLSSKKEKPMDAKNYKDIPIWEEPSKKDLERFKNATHKIKFGNEEIIERITKNGRRQFVYANTGRFVRKEKVEML